MRQSKLFFKTTREISNEIKLVSHQLLYRGGFIRESVAGRYYFLPLGMRVRDKIMRIIEKEMNDAGAVKIITPTLHPLELWKETNRTNSVGFELMTVKDRNSSEFAIGGTAEEMMVDLVRKFTFSYRDLPVNMYQFSQKFRDEKRARGGLLRTREFLMKDAYSFHTNMEDCKREYQVMYDTYKRIFSSFGLNTIPVEADSGYIGGDYSHEFMCESDAGEDTFYVSEDGSYSANEEKAVFQKENKNIEEAEKEMIEVDAPRGKTMEDGVKFHGLPDWQQLKDVVYVDEKGRFILAILRGDYDVNETKLKKLFNLGLFRPATDEEIREKLNSEPGFISPVGIKNGLKAGVELVIIMDDSLRTVKNFYGGSNKKDRDLLNVNVDRDFIADIEGDIAMAKEGSLSLNGSPLRSRRGIEVGHIFLLGDHYTSKDKMNAGFVDEDGTEKPYLMGCYGIGIDRNMAVIAEKFNDEKGIIWPKEVSPYDIHLIALGESENVKNNSEEIYLLLQKNGYDVLFDDREESAGVKFADSDLIGIPKRIIVSEKTLNENSVGLKKRSEKEEVLVKLDDLIDHLSK